MIDTSNLSPRVLSLVLPFASLLAVAACSESSDDGSSGATVGVMGTDTAGGASASSPAPGPATTDGPGAATSASASQPPTGQPSVSQEPASQPPATSSPAATTNTPGTPTLPATSQGPVDPGPETPPSTTDSMPTASGDGAGGDTSEPPPEASAGAGGAGDDPTAGDPPSSSTPTFHIFLLMGQSNMAGVAKFQDSDKNSDERLKVLGGCNQPAGQWNIANPPLSDCPGEKGWNLSDSVDPGIWFGKTLLEKLPEGDTIGLVGTAESGESINTFISGGSHHNMILRKIEEAKTAENARFAGIIFHQGESDNGQDTWPGKVVQLYNEVKAAWGVDYDVPFILGELPQGGCCSQHNQRVHEAAEQLPMGYWVSQEGTNVMDEYHFDHPSVVLMGTRYGETMLEALGW